MPKAPRILFVPVSGAFGMGEYARSLAIAHAARRRWPRAEIHFVLSRQAPYAATVPFAATLLDSSPTFHTRAVARLIKEWRPSIVVFDNAGRTAQLRAAQRQAARVVYISARSRQRRKAFRRRWMRLIDEHWIAYPELIAGELGWWERFKLKRLGRPTVRYLDVIMSRPEDDSIVARVGLKQRPYVLVVPGGGTGHPGADDAAGQFLAAANSLAETETVVFVGPTRTADAGVPTRGKLGNLSLPSERLRCFNSLPQADLVDLLGQARLVVTNGGSTLLQAIACGRACIAVPIARDQSERIERCVNAGVAASAALAAPSIVRAAGMLLRDEPARAALAQRAGKLRLANGIEIALNALAHLAEMA
ncbi:MAG TPA: UDP-N-acetylglucosamine 2-epimerase [Steroidobacteraceae bacterium]|nr:UDP-N-acetylglucosamine 2-epimerase [Steroidobacteraceae bacterium]